MAAPLKTNELESSLAAVEADKRHNYDDHHHGNEKLMKLDQVGSFR
jgi:hypothetical protein